MTITALTDTELLDQARNGDEAAFTELYVRHQAAALRLARSYKRMGDPDDLVNGAFERVLGALRRGAGPTESFRAYLFVTLRRLAAEQGERPADESLDEVPEPVSNEAGAGELDQADRAIITQAFEGLPDRWQAVLWHTAVEGRQPSELASVLGVTANAAAAMSYRSREKLRQAYLQAHLLASPAPDHEPWRSQLGAYVRDGLSKRDRAAVERHLDGCDSCTALVAELNDVNRTLARSVLPLFVLAGGGQLAAGAALGGAAAAGGAADGGGKGVFAKLRNLAPTVGSTAAIAAVVGGIVGMGSVVAREDGGPLNSAADAADIGGNGRGDDDGSRGGDDEGDGDSLFGDDDFALSPFDDPLEDDFGDFGDDFDFDDEFGDLDDFDSDFGDDVDGPSGLGTRPPRSRIGTNLPPTGGPGPSTPTTPPPTTPPPTTPPPTTPPPTTPPPTTPPPDPPAPAPVTFTASSWAPNDDGTTGTLHFEVGELAAASTFGTSIAPTAAPLAAPTLTLRVALNGGAQFDAVGQPDGCTATGARIDCVFAQPAPGQPGPAFDLLVTLRGEPSQTASAQILRAGKADPEATLPADIPLERYAAGLALDEPSVTPVASTDGRPVPAVQADFGIANTGAHQVETATVVITSTGDSAFVPRDANVEAAVKALTSRLGDAAAAGALRAPLTAPLPGTCVADKPPPTNWDTALVRDGLPHTVTCTVGPIAAGGSVSLADILVLGYPAFYNGNGRVEQGTVTATLTVGNETTFEPRTFTVPLGQASAARLADGAAADAG